MLSPEVPAYVEVSNVTIIDYNHEVYAYSNKNITVQCMSLPLIRAGSEVVVGASSSFVTSAVVP